MNISEIKDDGIKYYKMGFNVGLAGIDKTTLPAYPPLKPEVRARWLKGWKKGHDAYIINQKHKQGKQVQP